MPRPRGRDLAAFWRAVDKTGGPEQCWPWLGHLRDGYGVYGKPPVSAHRFSYELEVGPIPAGLVIDHQCEVRKCVNPAHLKATTQRENVLRSPLTMPNINAAKTKCPEGHPYDEANTYTRPGSNKRDCRTCRRSAKRSLAKTP